MSLSRIFYLRLALAVEQFGVTCEMLDDRIDKVMDAIKKLNRSNMAPHGPRAAMSLIRAKPTYRPPVTLDL